jgi:4'-phosphopantetheinyl transferase EntD
MAKLIFSAKECTYKCQYPVTHEFVEFAGVSVRITGASTFEVTFRRSVAEFTRGYRMTGVYARSDGLVLTAITLPA